MVAKKWTKGEQIDSESYKQDIKKHLLEQFSSNFKDWIK